MNNSKCPGKLATELFEDLHKVVEEARNGGDFEKLQLITREGKGLILSQKKGGSLAEALFRVTEDPDSQLGRLLFWPSKPVYNAKSQTLTGSISGRSLEIVIAPANDLPEETTVASSDRIVLHTDFNLFTFRRANEMGQLSAAFLVFTSREISEEIAFNGSILTSINPTHYAIISRTISCSFPQKPKDAGLATDAATIDDLVKGERDACDELNCFEDSSTRRLSLEALRIKMQSCSRPPKLLSELKEGAYTLRSYSPQRSNLFDFGEPSEEYSRDDFVTTYNVGPEEFHREFYITPRGFDSQNEELSLAAFDILNMLAVRRAKLFRTAFASRVYNILLPPVLLVEEGGVSHGYAIFPCLNQYRTSKHGFRRTLSITFMVCPVDIFNEHALCDRIVSRPASLEELHRLKKYLLMPISKPPGSKTAKKYVLSGLGEYYSGISNIATIPELLQHICKVVLRRMLANGGDNQTNVEYLLNSTLFTSNQESKIVTMALQVDWKPPEGFTQPWERWLKNQDDRVFHNGLYRTFFYEDYLDPYSADSSRHALNFKDFVIGNVGGSDMGGVTLFNPQDYLKIVFYPRARERYPNYSIVRWMAWQVYIDSALTSLRALIYKFHPILESRGDLHSIIDALDEMVQEFVEFYDLDIRDYLYRKEYERIRCLMLIDTDYAQLLAKFASSKDDESLREQRLINKLIVSLTIVTVTTAILSTMATESWISMPNYLIITVVLSPVMVWIGYHVFDPCRRGLKKLRILIKR